MLKWIPAPILGVISALLFIFNLLFWASLLFICAFFLLVPIKPWRVWLYKAIHIFPYLWTRSNNCIIQAISKTEWDIQGAENLKLDDWYLVISNHRGWIDIFLLFMVFNGKIPFLKFFMKRELLWQLPVASWVCWILNFPFMARYSKSYLKKHPELKNSDIEATRKVCEKSLNLPTSMLNFVEGRRFTIERQAQQNSPYKHLLKPKAAGVAFILYSMGHILNKLVNVTLVYPYRYDLWTFLTGRVKKIIIRVHVTDIDKSLIGNYQQDRNFRTHFQSWLNQVWQEKDEEIKKLLREEKQKNVS